MVRTSWRAGVRVVVGLGLGAWFGRVGRQPGGSEDVLAGPAFGGCIHTIVCRMTDQVRKGRKHRGNWMFSRGNMDSDFAFRLVDIQHLSVERMQMYGIYPVGYKLSFH